MDKIFSIGDYCFRLIYPDSVIPPANFMQFECTEGIPQYTYELDLCDRFPQPEGIQVAIHPDLAVFQTEEKEIRYIGLKGAMGYYACYWEESKSSAKVYIAKEKEKHLQIDPVFVSLLALERRLLEQGGMILHCAYLSHQGEAILFSAPSETGKTTQANLWEKYRGSHTINGDRALLQRVEGIWLARGWPVCGASGICHNEDMAIQAIVMLAQGKDDTVTRLTPAQAFSQIYSQITINSWNRTAQQQAMCMIEELITAVPVYHLSCTISEQAVKKLEQVVYGGQ